MLIDKINDCCSFAVGAADGLQGWLSEAISIVIVVFIFNFLAGWFLKKLHTHFEKTGKYWRRQLRSGPSSPLELLMYGFLPWSKPWTSSLPAP